MAGQIDTSIAFGMQNFFWQNTDETHSDFYYYGFLSNNGSTLIMQTTADGTAARYFLSIDDYATVWTGRLGYTYVTSKELRKLRI